MDERRTAYTGVWGMGRQSGDSNLRFLGCFYRFWGATLPIQTHNITHSFAFLEPESTSNLPTLECSVKYIPCFDRI